MADKHLNAGGFPCPECGEVGSEVVDSRPRPNSIRRRRECTACGARFTTVEMDARLILRIRRLVDTLPYVKDYATRSPCRSDGQIQNDMDRLGAKKLPDTPSEGANAGAPGSVES